MLYLSRLILNSRSPYARGDLSDCRALHQRILSAFPDSPDITQAREHYGALYRVESLDKGARILIQSHTLPDWSRLPADYLREPPTPPKRVDELYAAIQPGQTLLFRLRANPTKRLSDRGQTHPERWRGKRVELRTEEERIAWLARKGQASGFALLTVRLASNTPATAAAPEVANAADVADVRTLRTAERVTGRRDDQRLTFGSVLFEGRLRVTDPDAFRQALATGLGSGKAFGFGLLSIAPAPATT
jgi:CRISPR system Cascade subunit CasE